LISGPTEWMVTGAIILLATIGKFGGSAIAARLTGLRWREAGAIGVLMNTRGLMELIVLNIGMDLGVISPTMFTMLVIMALVTTFATTPILALIYPDREFAKDRPVETPSAVAGQPKPCTVMLAVADASAGPGLMTIASGLLAKRETPARVFALHLRTSAARPSVERQRLAASSADNPVLAPLFSRARDLMIDVRAISFVSVDPAADIRRTAEAKQANFLLLGAHKPLFLEGELGGTVADVLSAANQITGILLDRGLTRVRRVLVCRTRSAHDAAVDAVVERLAMAPDVIVTTLGEGVSQADFERIASEQDLAVIAIRDARTLDLSGAARRFRAMIADCPTSVLAVGAPVHASSHRAPAPQTWDAAAQPDATPLPAGAAT